MMRKSLDGGVLHAMRAFVRVVDTGSFTAAADQLMLTTAQVSRLVTDLEKRLQVKLLQRTTRQQALTDVGSDYLERCREVIALVDEAEASASGTAALPQGRLRIQCMANFGRHYISPLLVEFCETQPQLVVQYSTSQYMPDLLAKGVDVSIYLSESLPSSGLIARRLGTTFSILCAAPSYIARHGEPDRPTNLAARSCLRLVNPSITPAWKLITAAGGTEQLTPPARLIADTPEVLLEAAVRGAGIALLPLFSAINAVRSGQLRRVLHPWRSPDIGVYAMLPSRHFTDAKTRVWLDFVQNTLSLQLERDAAAFA